jgi:hypothetical protein
VGSAPHKQAGHRRPAPHVGLGKRTDGRRAPPGMNPRGTVISTSLRSTGERAPTDLNALCDEYGKGTGLGLSLSHDIVAQGHGGTLSVESHEGEGTTFSMMLPNVLTP